MWFFFNIYRIFTSDMLTYSCSYPCHSSLLMEISGSLWLIYHNLRLSNPAYQNVSNIFKPFISQYLFCLNAFFKITWNVLKAFISHSLGYLNLSIKLHEISIRHLYHMTWVILTYLSNHTKHFQVCLTLPELSWMFLNRCTRTATAIGINCRLQL